MKNWLLAAVLLGGMGAGAEVTQVTAVPVISFTASDSFSCRILRRRLDDAAKNIDGLNALLEDLKDKRKWRERHIQRVNSLVARIRNVPTEYYLRTVRVNLAWPVNAAWATVLDSPGPLKVRWSFKDRVWVDNLGITPEEVVGQWVAAEKMMKVTVSVSPVELCFGPDELSMRVSEAGKDDPALELQSNVEWL